MQARNSATVSPNCCAREGSGWSKKGPGNRSGGVGSFEGFSPVAWPLRRRGRCCREKDCDLWVAGADVKRVVLRMSVGVVYEEAFVGCCGVEAIVGREED